MVTDAFPAQSGHLTVTRSDVGDVRVVSLCGELDHAARDAIGDALHPPAGAEGPRTVVDLTGVTFMDSSGICSSPPTVRLRTPRGGCAWPGRGRPSCG
ncbi:STAS domain-containing protein [Streptomyces tauricus]|uniref:STAS domain-containing protein n=1 Tax=Streptomyces tauricus TaxID=68274 RepID=UPI0037F176A9